MEDRKYQCRFCNQVMSEQYRQGHLWYHRFDVFSEIVVDSKE